MKKEWLVSMVLLSFCFLPPASAADEYRYVSKIGTSGYDAGSFWQSWGIAADKGYLYVTDNWTDWVTKLRADGTFVLRWGGYEVADTTINSGDREVDGKFSGPNGVAVDQAGNVYVVDTHNARIQKFTSDGVFIAKWGSAGTGDGQFDWPVGIAVDAAGNVYVTDRGNDRIQKFSSDGAFITKWGSFGTGDGQFGNPNNVGYTQYLAGIAVDSAGYVYVTDYPNYRVQKFTSNGVFVAKWGSFGTGNGQFGGTQIGAVGPEGIAVDQAGFVYVTDAGNNRNQKFTSDGVYVTQWEANSFPGEDGGANNIAVDQACNVFTVDEHSGGGMNHKYASTSMSCCKVTLDKTLNLYIPVFQYGSNFWLNMGYMGGGATFGLNSYGLNTGNVIDPAQFSQCTPVTLLTVPNTSTVPATQDLIMDIQSLEYHDASGNNTNLWLNLKYTPNAQYPDRVLFDVSNYGLK